MIINKFSSIFGIKDLVNCNFIDGNTLIYSPNGTMKSSFCDGISAIVEGKDPSDVEKPNTASFDLSFGDVHITEKDPLGDKAMLICVSGNEGWKWCESMAKSGYVLEEEDRERIARLAISDSLKKQYIALAKKKKDLEDFIVEHFLSRKGKGEKAQTITSNYIDEDKSSFWEYLLTITNDDIKLAESLSDIQFDKISDITSSKTCGIIDDESFSDQRIAYKDAIRDYCTSVFSQGFLPQDLEEMRELAVKNHFFDAGNRFYLDSKVVGEKEIEAIVKDGEKIFRKDPKVKKAFEAITKKTGTDKGIPLKNLIQKNPVVLEMMGSSEQFKKTVFIRVINDTKLLKEKIQMAQELKNGLQKLRENSNACKTDWEEVAQDYNNKFIANGFTVKIINTLDAAAGIELPQIALMKKDKLQTSVPDSLAKRLSTGEKRSLWILNTEIKIKEARREADPQKPIVLVFDDVSDSFDLNNKYGIIEYFQDLLEKEAQYQLIILTHSFDFFKALSNCCRHYVPGPSTPRLGSGLACLLAYKESNDEIGNVVDLQRSDARILNDLTKFNEWKNRGDEMFAYPSIPYLRVLETINQGSENERVISIDRLLHYFAGTPMLSELIDVYHNSVFGQTDGGKSDKPKYPKFLDLLDPRESCFNYVVKRAKAIMSDDSVKKEELQNKILLGICIRLSSEKICYDALKASGHTPEKIEALYGRKLLNPALNLDNTILPTSTKDLLKKSFIVSPSYAHANSFLESPLIDVGSAYLESLAKNLLAICNL